MTTESDYRRFRQSFEEAARLLEEDVLPRCAGSPAAYGLEQLVLYAHMQAQQYLEMEMKEAGEDPEG